MQRKTIQECGRPALDASRGRLAGTTGVYLLKRLGSEKNIGFLIVFQQQAEERDGPEPKLLSSIAAHLYFQCNVFSA